jgi:precorrin-6A/cobalt-precorrin-6A reductase
LVLGGTGEARELAAAIVGRPGTEVLSTLAGRTRRPARPAGRVRVGGFGGIDGLLDVLRTERVDAVVDATHPFAATITEHAAHACAAAGVPHVVLRRPEWTQPAGEAWHRAESVPAAADLVRELAPEGSCVFLTTGRQDLAAFAGDAGRRYLVRTIDPPDGPLPPHARVLLARGPYTLDGELALLRENRVRLLVTKDSGGSMTAAKLTAAARLGVPVVVVSRPPLPPGAARVDDVAGALAWLDTVRRHVEVASGSVDDG